MKICVRVACIINNTYRREFHIHSFRRLSTWRDSLHHYYLCGCTLSCSHPPECALGSFLTNRLAPSGGWKHQGGWFWCVRGVGRVAAGILHLYILYAGSVVVGLGYPVGAGLNAVRSRRPIRTVPSRRRWTLTTLSSEISGKSEFCSIWLQWRPPMTYFLPFLFVDA